MVHMAFSVRVGRQYLDCSPGDPKLTAWLVRTFPTGTYEGERGLVGWVSRRLRLRAGRFADMPADRFWPIYREAMRQMQADRRTAAWLLRRAG